MGFVLPMPLKWTPIPLVRIAILFCGGILVGVYQQEIVQINWACLGFASAFLMFLIFMMVMPTQKRWIGLFAFICMFIGGYLVVLARTASRQQNHILYINQPIEAYEGYIRDHLHERKSSFKTLIEIERVKTGTGWHAATGKINLYVSKNTFQDNVQWGNRVVVVGGPSAITPPANPHEFDFKRFLTFKNIYHQHFVQGSSIAWSGEIDKDFFFYAAKARRFFSDIIKQYVVGEQEQAIALALVIGVVDGVDNELEKAYAASGAMHVLAVSGLHIGIIYGIILFFLKPLQRRQNGKWLIAAISLSLLWGYSFVTGLSPSVLRAVTMFSFIAIAKPLSIRSNIFNTLAGSAIILLLVDPYLIMSVGFQLSYLAVLGIIWIQRPLYLLWEAKTWLTDQVWQITCVSISAQLTTFSLGLLYFHQFPTYFLFSNLFVIPISFGVLVVGIVLLTVSPFAWIAKLVGWLLWALVKLLNEGVFLVERLPFSLINDIYIDVFQSWLIMGMVTGLIFTFQFKNIRWAYTTIVLAVMFSLARWTHQLERFQTSKLYVYQVNGVTAFELVDGSRAYLVADSGFMQDTDRFRFHIKPNRLFNLVNNSTVKLLPPIEHMKGKVSFQYQDKLIYFFDQKVSVPPIDAKVDVVILASRAVWQTAMLMRTFPSAKLVLDGSCTRGQINWLHKQQIDFSRVHAVVEKGAFSTDLKAF